MSSPKSLPDLLKRSEDVRGDDIFYRFANGLEIKTEIFHKSDPQRILPLGSPQGCLMNHLLGFPESARGKRVFEPFAGSGALGFMALKAGAREVDFLDINPRAAEFHRESAELSGLDARQFRSITQDIETFAPDQKYDLILANPPFVPTPEGIEGTLTSNGGSEGSRFVDLLLGRLEQFLESDGRALIYVFQFVKESLPLIMDALNAIATRRSVELTPAQSQRISLDAYSKAYVQLFPQAVPAIDAWRSALLAEHGSGLELCHYVVDIGPCTETPGRCEIRENFSEKFGEDFMVPSESEAELAFGRVFENFVPPPPPN